MAWNQRSPNWTKIQQQPWNSNANEKKGLNYQMTALHSVLKREKRFYDRILLSRQFQIFTWEFAGFIISAATPLNITTRYQYTQAFVAAYFMPLFMDFVCISSLWFFPETTLGWFCLFKVLTIGCQTTCSLLFWLLNNCFAWSVCSLWGPAEFLLPSGPTEKSL